MEGGCWRERGVVSSGDAHHHSWAVVLSPHLLLSCIGISVMSLIVVMFTCVRMWVLCIVIGLSSRVVISLLLCVLVTSLCHVHCDGLFFMVLGCHL